MANQRRSRRRHVALQERLARELSATSSLDQTDSETALVHEALRRLGRRDREVLLLAEWEGLSPTQIGAVLGCLAVTARGRLHRARRRFGSVFDELRAREDLPTRETPERRMLAKEGPEHA
jgi:RNA polymerase sigma factor (sigma-70 family)